MSEEEKNKGVLICDKCGANLADVGIIESSEGGHGETQIHIKDGYIVYESATIENMDSIVAICGNCKEELEEPIDEILWALEEVSKPLPDVFDVVDAYRELWAAVENGTLKEDFFKLREKIRTVLG